MKNCLSIIESLIDKAIWECVFWPDPRSEKARSSKAGKPGELIMKLPPHERKALEKLKAEDLQHRLPEILKDMLTPKPIKKPR